MAIYELKPLQVNNLQSKKKTAQVDSSYKIHAARISYFNAFQHINRKVHLVPELEKKHLSIK